MIWVANRPNYLTLMTGLHLNACADIHNYLHVRIYVCNGAPGGSSLEKAAFLHGGASGSEMSPTSGVYDKAVLADT